MPNAPYLPSVSDLTGPSNGHVYLPDVADLGSPGPTQAKSYLPTTADLGTPHTQAQSSRFVMPQAPAGPSIYQSVFQDAKAHGGLDPSATSTKAPDGSDMMHVNFGDGTTGHYDSNGNRIAVMKNAPPGQQTMSAYTPPATNPFLRVNVPAIPAVGFKGGTYEQDWSPLVKNLYAAATGTTSSGGLTPQGASALSKVPMEAIDSTPLGLLHALNVPGKNFKQLHADEWAANPGNTALHDIANVAMIGLGGLHGIEGLEGAEVPDVAESTPQNAAKYGASPAGSPRTGRIAPAVAKPRASATAIADVSANYAPATAEGMMTEALKPQPAPAPEVAPVQPEPQPAVQLSPAGPLLRDHPKLAVETPEGLANHQPTPAARAYGSNASVEPQAPQEAINEQAQPAAVSAPRPEEALQPVPMEAQATTAAPETEVGPRPDEPANNAPQPNPAVPLGTDASRGPAAEAAPPESPQRVDTPPAPLVSTPKPPNMVHDSINIGKLTSEKPEDLADVQKFYVDRAAKLGPQEALTDVEIRSQARQLGLTADRLAQLPVGWKPSEGHLAVWTEAVRQVDQAVANAHVRAQRAFDADPTPDNKTAVNDLETLHEKTAQRRASMANQSSRSLSIHKGQSDPFIAVEEGDLFKPVPEPETAKGAAPEEAQADQATTPEPKTKVPKPRNAANKPPKTTRLRIGAPERVTQEGFGAANKYYPKSEADAAMARIDERFQKANRNDLTDCAN